MHEDLRERFLRSTGSEHYLTAQQSGAVEHYLRQRGFLIPGEEIMAVLPAGEGNMNVTLRVVTNRRRVIVKQSRPWVRRFPDLPAPVDRIHTEKYFHQAIRRNAFLAGHMPEILRADDENYVLILEDLGAADDLTTVYDADAAVSRKQLRTLLHFARELHGLDVSSFPDNRKLRQLNHAHIFDLPFRSDNGFPLDAIYPGLGEVARPYQHDAKLRAVVREIGEAYLSGGPFLIHGDYYPGSFLQTEERVYVIDAEFAHLGRPEFDIGVLMGHLLMSRASEKRILQIDEDYRKPVGFDSRLARRFCYVEIMRRIIGIAQLPLSLSLDERKHLLERARVGLL